MANIELDGANKKIIVDSGDLTLDIPGDIIFDADGGDLTFADGGTNLLKITNSSSDVVFQPQVDTKDIVFKQYDGTVVATVEDNATFNIPASKLAIGGTAVTSTAAELNILDGVTATASELNLLDGGTSVGGSITLADADGFVVNDGGTMKTIPASDISTYAGGNMVLLHEAAVTGETAGSDDYTDAAYFHATNYDRYRVYIDEYEPETDGSNLLLQLYLGDELRTGSNYEYHTKLFQSNSDAAMNRSTGASSIRIIDDTGNASNESARCWFEYGSHETDNAAFFKLIQYSFVTKTSGDTTSGGWGAGSNEQSTGALYGFRLLPSAGGLGNYKIRIYGIKS